MYGMVRKIDASLGHLAFRLHL